MKMSLNSRSPVQSVPVFIKNGIVDGDDILRPGIQAACFDDLNFSARGTVGNVKFNFFVLLPGTNFTNPFVVNHDMLGSEKLQTEPQMLYRVLFLGQIDNQDLPPYYSAADVVVIPSLDEGFGVVALEAMSSGKPIIATAVGGLKEIVDSKTGIIVPPGDSNALSNAILVVLKEHKMARLMGIKGRRNVGKYFNWTLTAKKLSSIYSEMLVNKYPLVVL